MIEVFLFHIDLTLTVAMVTENGRQIRLKETEYLFWTRKRGLKDKLFNFKISAKLNSKKTFQYFMYLVNIYHLFKYLFGICLCSISKLPVIPPNFGPKCLFYSSLFWRQFSVSIATVKVKSILSQNP